MKNPQMNDLEYRIGTLEAYLDLEPNAPADDEWPCTIHELIADEMTGVTADMHKNVEGAISHCRESAAALVTVLGEAADKRMDVICKRADLMFEVMQMMTARIEALEQQNALLNRQAH